MGAEVLEMPQRHHMQRNVSMADAFNTRDREIVNTQQAPHGLEKCHCALGGLALDGCCQDDLVKSCFTRCSFLPKELADQDGGHWGTDPRIGSHPYIR